MKKILAVLGLALIPLSAYAQNPGVFFVEPKDGAIVGPEFRVVMGVKGMAIKPAGDKTKNTGHHHLLVDTVPLNEGEVIPADERHLHLGKGQTEITLKLAPGRHTLQLQFADGAHRSYGEAMRTTILVAVK